MAGDIDREKKKNRCKETILRRRKRRQKQMREIGEIIKYGGIGITFVAFIGLVIYIMMILSKPANAIEVWGQDEIRF